MYCVTTWHKTSRWYIGKQTEVTTVVIIYRGQIYLDKDHIEQLKNEPDYVRTRYQAIAAVVFPVSTLSTGKAAKSIGVKTRQFNRILKRFKKDCIAGIRHRSRRPHNSPTKAPDWLEDIVVKVRERSGFGPYHLAVIINRVWPKNRAWHYFVRHIKWFIFSELTTTQKENHATGLCSLYIDRSVLRAYKNRYRRRAVIEGLIGAFKSRFGEHVRSKRRHAQRIEILFRVVVWNAIAVAYHCKWYPTSQQHSFDEP